MIHIQRAAAALALTALAYGAAWGGTAVANAVPVLMDVPQCQLEDGSDVDGLCVWVDPDTGAAYLNPEPMQKA